MLGQSEVASMPVSAGADLGLNNLITIAFSDGSKSKVLSNQRFEHKVSSFDKKIDQLKASMATTAVAALRARKDVGVKLTPAEIKLLWAEQRAIYEDDRYIQLVQTRDAWIADALHKASCGIVGLLAARQVKVLATGKNKGWKDEVDMGRKMNRRFLATAHARLIDLLRYKCEEAGILLIETEESYTSKTSFAGNESLRIKRKPIEQAMPAEPVEPTTSALRDPRASGWIAAGSRRAVRGAKTSSQHAFSTKGLLSRWRSIHADVNGAFNILRKVYAKFRCHNGLSSAFDLLWLSPKMGVTPFAS